MRYRVKSWSAAYALLALICRVQEPIDESAVMVDGANYRFYREGDVLWGYVRGEMFSILVCDIDKETATIGCTFMDFDVATCCEDFLFEDLRGVVKFGSMSEAELGAHAMERLPEILNGRSKVRFSFGAEPLKYKIAALAAARRLGLEATWTENFPGCD